MRGRSFDAPDDPDLMLYSGGFFSEQDKRVMEQLRAQTPEALATGSFVFEDSRLPEMLFRYRARNYPGSLSPAGTCTRGKSSATTGSLSHSPGPATAWKSSRQRSRR